MAAPVPGYNIEQMVETVANNDVAMNASLTAKQADGWLASWFIPYSDDSSVIIVFTRPATAV